MQALNKWMSYVIANLAPTIFFLILWCVWIRRVEEGGWLFTLYRLFFWLCSSEFFSRKKKKLYLRSYFYELWILNSYCVFERKKWEKMSYIGKHFLWLSYIIFSSIYFNFSNIRRMKKIRKKSCWNFYLL